MTSSNLRGTLTGEIQDDLSVPNGGIAQGKVNGVGNLDTIPDGNIAVANAEYDAATRTYSIEGKYGTFYFTKSHESSVNTIGTWTYFLDRNEKTKALSEGARDSEEFHLTYTSGAVEYTGVVSIAIIGTDDPFVFDKETGYSLSVDENSAVDTSIGGIEVTDVDSTPLVKYSITAISFEDSDDMTQEFMGDDLDDVANNPFAINEDTGDITVRKLLDHENNNPTSYMLTIQATNNPDDPGASTANTITTEVTIQVNNVLEFILDPEANNNMEVKTDSYTIEILEDKEVPLSKAEIGIKVGQVFTESVTNILYGRSVPAVKDYTITAGNKDLFGINRDSGEIFLKNPDAAMDPTDTQPLNYVPGLPNIYELEIQATAGPLESRTTVTIMVKDVDDTAPIPVPSASNATIAEKGDGVDSDLTFTITDPDTAQSKFIPDYWTIDEVDDAGNATESVRFEIVRMDNTDTWKLKLITGKSLDAESESTINLQILLTDGTNESTTPVEIQVNVDDVDEYAPELHLSNGDIGTIEENDAGANSGIAFTVTDEDRTENPIAPSGFEISGDQHDKFKVVLNDDGVTWRLTLKDGQALDREYIDLEHDGKINLSITVNDGDKTSEAKDVIIDVTDVDEFAPELEPRNGVTTGTIEENATGANPSITFTVTDEDSTKHPIDSDDFRITGEQSNKFEVVDDNGVWKLKLQANQSLNYEEDSTLNLQILVDDGSRESEAKNITINVTDVNDNAPLLIAYPSTANITENAVASDSGVAFFVVDADIDAVNSFEADHFIIAGEQSSKFEVVDDNGTWRLKLKADQSLNHEEDDIINLQVTVHDGSNVSNAANVVVNVDNVDEGKATYRLNATSTAVGDVVTVTRSDDDPDGNGDGATSYRWSRINPIKGTFATIDETDVNSYTLTGDDMGYIISVIVIYTDGAGRATQVSTNGIIMGGVNAPPVLSSIGTANILDGVGGGALADNIDTGVVFTVSDANNTPATFTTESFTITGEQSDKFEVVDDNGVWRLKLKSGQSLDHSSDNSVALQVAVDDGLDISNTVSVNVTVSEDIVIEKSVDSSVFLLEEQNGAIVQGFSFNFANFETEWVNSATWEITVNGRDVRHLFAVMPIDDDTYMLKLLDDKSLDFESGFDHDGNAHTSGVTNFDISVSLADVSIATATGSSHYEANAVTTSVDIKDVNLTDYNVSVNEYIYGQNNSSSVTTLVAPSTFSGNVVASIETVNGLGSSSVFALEQVGSGNSFNLELQDGVILYHENIASYRVLVKFESNVGLPNYQVESQIVYVNVRDTVSTNIDGTDSAEIIGGDFGDNTIYAEGGNDIIYGGHGNDSIVGRSGSDTLRGGEGNDKLYGSYGRDILYGEGGIDILFGNSERDWFILDIVNAGAADVDIVGDFTRGSNSHNHDFIRVDTPNGNETSFAALGLRVEQVANKVIAGHGTGVNFSKKRIPSSIKL